MALTLCFLVAAKAGAQTTAGSLTVLGNADFSTATRTLVWKKGTSLPGTCTIGDSYFKTDATAGQNLYGCTSANTWTQLGGAGNGTVNSGTGNQLAYYATTGTAVSGLSSANSGVLVTNGSGVPSISTTLPSGLALGTPASGTLTNATGLPISTGVAGLGSGVATFAATPSSANLLSALTDETGTGAAVFGTDPTFTLTDVTTNNATTSQHGWLPKLPGGTSTWLRADGTFTAPPGASYTGSAGVNLIGSDFSADCAVVGCLGAAVTWSNTSTFTGVVDASGATSTAPNKSGTSLPATCTVGQTYVKTDADKTKVDYRCTATDTWTQQVGDRTGASITATTGGTSTAYTLALTPSLTAYADGLTVRAKLHAANGASPTLSVDSIGAKPIYRRNAAATPSAIQASALAATVYEFTYDSALNTTGAWVMTLPFDISTSGGVSSSCASGTCALSLNPVSLSATTSVTLAGPSAFAVCTSTCTITVPVPVAGYQFCVLNGNNVSTVITLAAIGSSARYENTARTAYGTAGTGTLVSGGAAGDKVCILGLDSTHYLTVGYQGTWTAN